MCGPTPRCIVPSWTLTGTESDLLDQLHRFNVPGSAILQLVRDRVAEGPVVRMLFTSLATFASDVMKMDTDTALGHEELRARLDIVHNMGDWLDGLKPKELDYFKAYKDSEFVEFQNKYSEIAEVHGNQ